MDLMAALKNELKEDYIRKITILDSLKDDVLRIEKLKLLWGEKDSRNCDVSVDHWGDINVNIWLGKGDAIKEAYFAFEETIWDSKDDWNYCSGSNCIQYYKSGIEVRVFASIDSNCSFKRAKTGRLIEETETVIRCS